MKRADPGPDVPDIDPAERSADVPEETEPVVSDADADRAERSGDDEVVDPTASEPGLPAPAAAGELRADDGEQPVEAGEQRAADCEQRAEGDESQANVDEPPADVDKPRAEGDEPRADDADDSGSISARAEDGADSGGEVTTGAGAAVGESAGGEPLGRRLRGWFGRHRLPAAAAMVVVAVAAVLLVRFPPFGLPEGAALRVGDTVVSEADLQERVEVLRALYGVQPPAEGPDLDRFRRDAAKAVAVSTIVEDAAGERGIVIADRAVQDTLGQMIDQQMGADGREAFVQLLTEVGTSEAEVLNEIRLQQLTARLRAAVTADVPAVTDEEVRARFDNDPAGFVSPEQRSLRNVVVSTREEADAVLAEARAGDLGALAATRSLDASTRDQQGDLGFVTRAQVEQPYGDLAFTVPAGELFGPVQNQYGWNVGQVIEVRPATPLPFEQIAGELRAAMDAERVNTAWREYLAERIREADVEYADQFEPADPDAPPGLP